MNDLLGILGFIIFVAWLIGGCSNCIYINKDSYCIGLQAEDIK